MAPSSMSHVLFVEVLYPVNFVNITHVYSFFLSCISLFRIAFTHHNHDTYWNSIFNTAQQKFFTNIGQGHNLCKPKTFIT